MDSVELVKQICAERKIPISKLERDLDFSNGYIRKLKEGKFPSDRLQKIADYLGVSVNYLLDQEINEKVYYSKNEISELAQKMFDDPDMQSLYHMKQKIDPKQFRLYMDYIKGLYELEHPKE